MQRRDAIVGWTIKQSSPEQQPVTSTTYSTNQSTHQVRNIGLYQHPIHLLLNKFAVFLNHVMYLSPRFFAVQGIHIEGCKFCGNPIVGEIVAVSGDYSGRNRRL